MRRTIIATLLWVLVVFAFIFALRSSMVTTVILERFQESMPPDQVIERMLATEFGKEYIREWVTWHDNETNERRLTRLRVFNTNLGNSGIIKAEQSFAPTSVTVLSNNKLNKDYVVSALVMGGETPMAFEVKVGFSEGRPYGITQPVMVAVPTTTIKAPSLPRSTTTEQVNVFTQRFLEAFLEGKTVSDTSIYTVPDVIIQPAGNAKLVRVEEVRGDSDKNPSLIKVNYQIYLQGATLKQEMVIHLTWKDGKPLVRHIEP